MILSFISFSLKLGQFWRLVFPHWCLFSPSGAMKLKHIFLKRLLLNLEKHTLFGGKKRSFLLAVFSYRQLPDGTIPQTDLLSDPVSDT